MVPKTELEDINEIVVHTNHSPVNTYINSRHFLKKSRHEPLKTKNSYIPVRIIQHLPINNLRRLR